MGTSKGYLPPTGYLWPEAKRDVTSMVKKDFTPTSVGKAVSSFSKALGSRGKSHSVSAAKVGTKVLSFINAVKSYGFVEALEKTGLSHLRGKSSEEIQLGLLDYFSESGNDFYDSVAHQSMNELMRELLKSARNEEDYNEIIGSINTGEFIREFVIKFIQNCFFANFAEKILSMFDTLNKYDDAEKSVKTYIRTSIVEEFPNEEILLVDWNHEQGNRIIIDKCNVAMEILSVWSDTLV